MISVALLHIFSEANTHSNYGAIAFLGGFVAMYLFEEIFTPHSHKTHEDHVHEDPHTHSHHIAYTTFFALFLHTIFDGMAIYSSLSLGTVASSAVILGVAIHQIPVSLSLSAIFKKSKISKKLQIILLSLFALAVAIGYGISAIFGHIFGENFNTIFVAIAGGSLLYIASVDLLPSIHSENSKKFVNIFAFLFGIAILTIFHFFGEDIHGHNHNHSHKHHHEHSHSHEKLPHQEGIFEDSQVKDRTISDYTGEWQSIYPMMKSGDLSSVMQAKSEKPGAKMSAEEYTQYYLTGYESDIYKIKITENSEIFFYEWTEKIGGKYRYDGYKILTYASGKKGVRYLFSLENGDENAPKFVQFSDHEIAPTPSSHFHIFLGNTSHEKIFEEMDNWPTFYPHHLTSEEIIEEMLHH